MSKYGSSGSGRTAAVGGVLLLSVVAAALGWHLQRPVLCATAETRVGAELSERVEVASTDPGCARLGQELRHELEFTVRDGDPIDLGDPRFQHQVSESHDGRGTLFLGGYLVNWIEHEGKPRTSVGLEARETVIEPGGVHSEVLTIFTKVGEASLEEGTYVAREAIGEPNSDDVEDSAVIITYRVSES